MGYLNTTTTAEFESSSVESPAISVLTDGGGIVFGSPSTGSRYYKINNQDKTITVDGSEEVVVSADAGYTGLGTVTVNVDLSETLNTPV